MVNQDASRSTLAALMVACGFTYLMSNIAQFGLYYANIPPFATELLVQILIAAILILSYSRTGIRSDIFTIEYRNIMILLSTLLLSTFVSYIYSSRSVLVNQLLIQYVRALVILITLAQAIVATRSSRLVSYGALLLAVVGSLINLQDFVDPTFSQVPGRAAGLYENPNVSGAILVYLGLIGSFELAVMPTYLLWAVVSMGAALTFSRSAWIMLIVALVGLAVEGRLGRGRGRIIFVGMISILVGFIFLSLLSGDLYYIVSRSPLAEYLDPNTVARLGASGSLVDDYSSFEREGVLRAGWRAFLDAPVLGHGLGFTREWDQPVSTHNMFVLFLAERGLIGCLLYVGLLGAILLYSRGTARLLAVAVCIDAFFTHNQLDLMCEVCVISVIVASIGVRQTALDRPLTSTSKAWRSRKFEA